MQNEDQHQEQQDDTSFESAFEDLAKAEAAAQAPAPVVDADDDPVEPGGDSQDEPKPDAPAGGNQPAAAAPAADPPPKPDQTPPAKPAIEDEVNKLKGKIGWFEGTVEKLTEENRRLKAEFDKRAATPAPDAQNDAADAELESVLSELDDELPAVGKALRALANRLTKSGASSTQIRDEVMAAVDGRVKPIENVAMDVAKERHFSAIREVHPDFEELGKEDSPLAAWVTSQPAYLRDPLAKVLAEGQAKDINDLLTRFKKETGYGAATEPPPKPPAKPVRNREAEIKSAATVLKRTPASLPKSDPDPNDFEGAFAEFDARDP
jgi:hypothetical protein